jgi:hypothetical protein
MRVSIGQVTSSNVSIRKREFSMLDDVYKVYAVRYGRHEQRSSANYMGGIAMTFRSPLITTFGRLVGPHATLLVDTGFDEKRGLKRKRAITKPVAAGLKAIGIASESVKPAVISHMHYDHAGNHHLFPNAQYHLQECEMNYVTGRCMCHSKLRLTSTDFCNKIDSKRTSAFVHWTDSAKGVNRSAQCSGNRPLTAGPQGSIALRWEGFALRFRRVG